MATTNDVRIRVSTDTNEAVRQLRQMEKQVDKLGDLADQGERQQRGFLTRRQVALYQKLLKEMEQSHTAHVQKLSKAEQELARTKDSIYIKRARELEEEIKKRESLLRHAEGGNRWGEQSSPIVQEFHRIKLDEARSNMDSVTNSDGYKQAIQATHSLEDEIVKLREVVDHMSSERGRGDYHSQRVGELRERTYATDMAEGISDLLKYAAPLGMFGYASYAIHGTSTLREQERSAWNVSQKMGSFDSVEQHDEFLRGSIKDAGRTNGYDANASATTMGIMLQGGTKGDLRARTNDLDALQKFARANAMDVNEVAIAGSDLQKIGALNEGNLQKFTEMLAGAITKSNMNGREEELLRSTSNLAQTVSSGLSELSGARLAELMGIQTQLSEAIPTLSGDKGVQMLSSMDSAIKGGGNPFDLIMGKGILPEFSGVKGVYNLQMMKEQGLTSQNLKYMFQGLDRFYGEGQHEVKAMTAQQNFGLSIETYNKLVNSGLADQFKQGKAVGENELRAIGAQDILKDWKSYQGTSTSEVDSIRAYSENRQADHSQGYDEIDKSLRGGFNSMPDFLQHMSLIGAGALGGPLLFKGSKWLGKMASPKIGGGGGLSGMLGKGGGLWNSIKGLGSRALDGAKGFGGNLLANSGDDLLRGGMKLGTKIPVAGALLGTGMDQLLNPENSWAHSAFKGVGGAIGGALGFLGSSALGVSTGGLGFLTTGAATVGGGIAGEKTGDWLYNTLFGNKNKKEESISNQVISKAGMSYEEAVSALDQSNRQLGKTLERQSTEHTINVVVSGSIDGMTKQNEDIVADGIKDYYTKMAKRSSVSMVNLSLDQGRLT